MSASLVASVCHEIGNLLAGARLLAAMGGAAGDGRLARSLGRAGSLAALIPALLEAESGAGAGAAAQPRAVLEGLWRGIGAEDQARLRIEPGPEATLPRIAVGAEVLHHLLLAQLLVALDEAPGEVSIAAHRGPGGVSFHVRGDGAACSAAQLAQRVADAILRAHGGRVDRDVGASTGLRLWVPECAPAPR